MPTSNTWGLLVIKQNIEQMPEALDEAARIDGANDIMIYFKIVMPVCSATLTVIGLCTTVNHWKIKKEFIQRISRFYV